ncbi:MAG TPA: hypothetical protein VN923_00595 [Thermoanaerobaculia bacterium]|nr:hypothetical protein [Thermoanaerobaculia bacterium]
MNLDDVLQLQQPLATGGIRAINFFNGRLLTGKDLSREQAGRREADARLGLAIGDGVAFGLEVSRDAAKDVPAAPVLRIKAGLAINRLGQTLRLAADSSVALTRRFDSSSPECVFVNCNPIGDGVYVAGAGVYVLTIAPAQIGEGKAPTNGLDPANVRCSTDAVVEAVQFRLLSINPLRFADLGPGSTQFRNRLAYRCFGIEAREQGGLDPWRVDPPRYGLVDELRAVGLDDRDVPLGLVYWTVDGIQFVDTWAVRRRLLAPDALSGYSFQRDPLLPEELSSFSFLARRRRLVEAHAMCAQFQQHLADLLAAAANPATVIAAQHFRYLPPFGIVPLQTAPLRGFFEPQFFAGIVRRPPPGVGQSTEFIDVRLLGTLQELALAGSPTDLTQREFVWVYRPWQNVRAAVEGQPVQPTVAFASGLLPPLSIARFDMARYDYSNYADCCSGP